MELPKLSNKEMIARLNNNGSLVQIKKTGAKEYNFIVDFKVLKASKDRRVCNRALKKYYESKFNN